MQLWILAPFLLIAIIATTIGSPTAPVLEPLPPYAQKPTAEDVFPLGEAEQQLSFVAPGAAKYVVLGGGFDPLNSQGTIERNVVFFHEVADRFQVPDEDRKTLYGGKEGVKDVFTSTGPDDEIDALLSFVFLRDDCHNCSFRKNRVQADGPATRKEFRQLVGEVTSDLGPNQGLRFYFTGHGGLTHDNNYDNNLIYLWRDTMDAKEFTKLLDQAPQTAPSQFLMVQCYSGGFAAINYDKGNSSGKLSTHNRCGFFSQVAEAPAAGCSSDIEIREEYTPYFFGALQGQSESGEPIDADFDADGQIGSIEAHAYTLIHERSIDRPITTSSQLLRDLNLNTEPYQRTMTWESVYPSVEMWEEAVLAGLGEQLGIDPRDFDYPLNDSLSQHNKAQERYRESLVASVARRSVIESLVAELDDLRDQHPELLVNDKKESAAGNDLFAYMAARESLLDHAMFEPLMRAFQAYSQAKNEETYWRDRMVAWKRVHYIFETKAMELAMEEQARPERERYHELQACEAEPFFVSGAQQPRLAH